MRSKNIKCIILGNRNFGEFHKIIKLYSEEFGKIEAIAKGARKISSKFTGHLETLNFCHVNLYFGPRNIILSEIQTIRTHKKLHENLNKLKTGLQIADVTNQLVYENQCIDDLFEILEESLHHLMETEKDSLIIYHYITKLLEKTGHLPNFKETETNLNHKYQKFFHFLNTQPLTEIQKIKLSREEEQTIKNKLREVIENQIQRPLKSFNI